jgi:hypothetical protein
MVVGVAPWAQLGLPWCGRRDEPSTRKGCSFTPREAQIELAVHLIALVAFCIAQATGITAMQIHVGVGASLLKHGIEVIVGPVERVTDTVNAHRVLAASHPVVGRTEVSSGLVRMGHAGLLFLLIEPQGQRCTYGMIAR